MADPLSIASGITAVLTVAVQVVSTCHQYSSIVKGASAEIPKLIHELTSLMGVLTFVKAIINPECQEPWSNNQIKLPAYQEIEEKSGSQLDRSLLTRSQVSLLKEPLNDCKQALDEVGAKLINASITSKSKLGKVAKLLIWPLKQTETLALIRILESHKATFLCALTAQNLVIGLQVQNVVGDIRDTQNRLERRLDQSEAQPSGVYQWLSPVDYKGAHRAACRLRLRGTGTWMLESSIWRIWLEAERGFLWLYGIPGSGKTVLISTLLEYCISQEQEVENIVVYYYCDFREKKSQKAGNVLGSLICQLSKQLKEVPVELLEFFESHRTDTGQHSAPTYHELEVDALDECLNREALLLLLCFLPACDLCKVKVLVSSRQEGDIQAAFAQQSKQSTKTYAVNEDIRSYIDDSVGKSSRLSRLSPNLMEEVKDCLHTGANGMCVYVSLLEDYCLCDQCRFQWVQCQIEELAGLRTDRDIRRALNHLPRSLEDTYERIISRIRETDSVVAKRALTWLAFSARPLKLVELAEAVVVDLGITTMDAEARWDPLDLLSVIGSLVIYSTDGNITLAHHSIKDYLLSSYIIDRAPHFSLTEATSNVEIAGICLTYLLMEDFSSQVSFQEGELKLFNYTAKRRHFKTRCRDYPLLTYAAQYWPLHAKKYLHCSPPLMGLAYALMDPARTPNFWVWLESLIAHGRFGLQRLPHHLTPLYFAASFGLVEVVEKLLEAGVDINAPGGMYCGTPLHAAVFRKHPNVVAKLLKRGALITMEDANGTTPDELTGDREVTDQIQKWRNSVTKKKVAAILDGFTLLKFVEKRGSKDD